MNNTTIDYAELDKFGKMSDAWWDENGPFKHLHLMNRIRVGYIKNYTEIKGKSILDVGCGGGILSVPLYRLGGKVTGLDAEIDNIHIAKRYADELDYDINYVCDSIENFQEKKFDVVCSLEVIEHVADVQLFLKSICNTVNNRGLIFISTINRTIRSYLKTILIAEYFMKMVPVGTHDWDKFIKPSTLCALFNENGFDVLNISGMNYNVLLSEWYLSQNIDSNYIMVARKR